MRPRTSSVLSPAHAISRFDMRRRSVEVKATMKDLAIALDNRPGALAEMGEALGRAGVSIEGGGVFEGIAHFLFADAAAARAALDAAGIRVVAEHEVLVQKLRQDEAGQPRTDRPRQAP